MSNYEYSFKGVRISHCYDCPIGVVVQKNGDEVCIFNDSIECSDITRPVECPLKEQEIGAPCNGPYKPMSGNKCFTCEYEPLGLHENPCSTCDRGHGYTNYVQRKDENHGN